MRVDLGSKNGIRLGSHAHGFLTAMIYDWNACTYYYAVDDVRSLSKGRAQGGIYPYDEHFARTIGVPSKAIISTLSGRVSGINSDIRQRFCRVFNTSLMLSRSSKPACPKGQQYRNWERGQMLTSSSVIESR